MVLHMRDLGSHLNTTARAVSTTLTKRLRDAARMARRIAKLNMDVAGRAHPIQLKLHAGALYGVEACSARRKAQARYRAAIVAALGGEVQ